MPIVDIFEFIAYTLRNGEKRQNSKLRLEKVRVMSAKVVGLSIIALTGAVAIWIACQLQIQWLGIVGLFVVALADAVLFGEGLSNHKNYEDIPIHVMTILLMVMIVVALLKLLDPVVIVPIVPIVSVMASYGIAGITSWFLAERSYRGASAIGVQSVAVCLRQTATF